VSNRRWTKWEFAAMFGVMQRNLTILLVALTTSGCISQSGIQSKYVSQQNECRGDAAKFVSGLAATADVSDAQSAAGTRFSECMNKAGWRVAVPKPTQVATGPAPNPPTGSPSTNPSAAISSAAAPAPVSGGVSPSEGTASIYRGQHAPAVEQSGSAAAQYNPPSGAPSVNPSAAAARVAQPAASAPVSAPAQYSPARPSSVTTAPYGQGAGRQF
jgi:hypothetical protein